MSLVRRRLPWIVSAWLLCQLTGLAAAPFALCCTAADELPECCRTVGPGQTCPMHHGGHDDSTCKMRNGCASGDSALISLGGGLGVLPSSTSGVTPFASGEDAAPLTASAIDRAEPPDSPPPRA